MSTPRWLVFGLFVSLNSCDRKEVSVSGQAPPPLVTAQKGVCDQKTSPTTDTELQALSLGTLNSYCDDPHAKFAAYGEGANAPLDDVCLHLFNGECEVYKSYGLVRVNTGRYVHASGSPAAVSLYVSRFLSQDGAYGFFSKRVVGGTDPKLLRLRKLDAGVVGALGAGVAYVFAGHTVAELSYTNELETPAQMRASAAAALPPLARALGKKLKGGGELPRSVQLLPVKGRLEFGIELVHRDILGQTGAGAGAVGFYQDGTKRYRVMVAHRGDDDSAKDTLRTLRRSRGRKDLKDMPYDAFELNAPGPAGSPSAVWLVAKHRNLVVAVGDEPFALRAAMTDAEKAPLCIHRAAKLALIREVFRSNASSKPSP